MFLLYGFSFIPFAYLVSFFSKKPSTGFAFISIYNIIVPPIILTLVAILFLIVEEISTFYLIAEFFFVLCPNILFLTGFNMLHKTLGYNTFCHITDKISCASMYIRCEELCSEYNPIEYENTTSDYPFFIFTSKYGCHKWINPLTNGIRFYLCFISYGIIYFILIFIIQTKYKKILTFFKRISNNQNHNFQLQQIRSMEVRQESQHVSQLVRSGDFNSEAIIVDKLTKNFKNSLIIPNKLSFSVHKEECFGLLGINGSGKTTSFRLITGDLDISFGNAYLDSNTNLLTNRTQFYSRIGYCPQNDALLDRLTGIQTLRFFGRLRGLDSQTFETFITNIIDLFGLKNVINKELSAYSGGNRRKISLAIALIGTPSLLLLDEPTTGVDPDSRLKIWKFLRDLMINYKISILLTSHNMEECEALCSRIAIMSNGILQTIGYIGDIKKKYAKGFTIILKVNINCDENIVEHLKSRVYESFGDNCLLKYENFGVIYYNLVSETLKLSQIFSTLENLKTEFSLEDYYVSNASLEQAFLQIVHNCPIS